MTWTQTTLNIKDAAGTNRPVIAYTDGTNFSFANPILDGSGAIIQQSNPMPIVLPPKIQAANAVLTRPADVLPYASLDFIAASVTAASCTLANSAFTVACARGIDVPGRMPRIKLERSGVALGLATFRLNAYNQNPLLSAPAAGDNGALNPADLAGHLGSFDVTCNRLHGNGTCGYGVPVEGSYVEFQPVTGTANVYFLLEARAAFVPSLGVASAVISAAGSGYVVNDTITLTGGTATSQAVLTVTGVSGGAVTTASVKYTGAYSVMPTNPAAQGSTSGSGTGATFTLTSGGEIFKLTTFTE